MKIKYINKNGSYGTDYIIKKKNHHVACTFHVVAFGDFLIISSMIVFYNIPGSVKIEPVIINRVNSNCYVRCPLGKRPVEYVPGHVKSITAAGNLYMDDVIKKETKHSKEFNNKHGCKTLDISIKCLSQHKVRKITFEGIPWIS